MAQYTAATAAVNIVPRLTKGWDEKLRSEITGKSFQVKVTPDFSKFVAPNLRPIPVNVQPNIDNAALARIEQALRALPKIQLDADSSAAQQKIAEVRGRLETLRDRVINLQVSDSQARAELSLLQRELSSIDRMNPSIDVQVDAAAASAALAAVDREVSGLSGRTARVGVDADTGAGTGKLAAFSAALSTVDGKTAHARIDVDATGALASIAKVTAAIAAIGGAAGVLGGLAGGLLGVGAAGGVAAAGLGVAGLASMGVGKAMSAMSAQQETAGATARQAAQQQQQAAQQVESAQIRLGQASQAAGRARADAARSVTKAEEQSAASIAKAHQTLVRASADAAKARADGARSVAAAERQSAEAVAAARESAQRRILSANQALISAQRRYDAAVRDSRQAQADLTRAWEDGRRALQDLQDQVDTNALDQRQAAFDLADARKALVAAQATGDADQIARAQLAVDRQIEQMDQLSKRTQRNAAENAAANRAGVAGTQQYRSALEKVQSTQESQTDAGMALASARANVRQADIDGAAEVAKAERDGAERVASARVAAQDQIQAADQRVSDARSALLAAEVDGAQRVQDAREQGARQIQAADEAVIAAQRALQQAMAQTGTAGQSAADKVAQAFANLSPAAAAFARYLYGLKPVLDGLSATAAAGLFPPLQQGIDTLLTRLPLINTVVGQLAAGLGAGLKLVLTQLANPFWTNFFTTLGNVAGTVIPAMFAALMSLAQAVAQLVLAFLPLAPAGFAVVQQLAGLVGYLAPFLAQLLGALIPTASLFIQALYPLGPLLAALAPILAALGGLLAQVLGALLTALTPVLVALTPLFQQLATMIGTWLVGAIQAVTPFLVQVATWMSQNPGLVLAVAAAVAGLALAFQGLMWVGGLVGALAPLGPVLAAVTGSAGGLSGAMSGLGIAARFLLGPWGLLIGLFAAMYATSAPFRDAINGLLGVLLNLAMAVISAVMPIFGVLLNVFTAVVTTVATMLVPVINVVAAVLQWLTPIIVPLVGVILGIVAAVRAWAIVQGILNAVMAMNPIMLVVLAIAALVAAAVWAYQNLTWFKTAVDAIGAAFVWLWQAVLVPIGAVFGAIFAAIGAAAVWLWQTIFMPVLSALGTAWNALLAGMQWAWQNILAPVFDFIGLAARILFAIVATVLITPLLIAWNLLMAGISWAWQNILLPCWQAIQAAAGWLWSNVLMPIFAAIGAAWNALMAGVNWVWLNILKPCWDAIVAALNWLYLNIWIPIMAGLRVQWQMLMDAINWVWLNILKPCWDAIIAALNWLYNNVWLPIMGYLGSEWQKLMDLINWVWLNILKPCFDAVAAGLSWLRDRFNDAVTWIGDIWNRIRGLLAKPINFMIDVVWNRGVVPAWNAVAGLVGLGPIATLPLIPEAATGGRVDTAGRIRGPGSGTSDSIMARVAETDRPLRVSNREFIVNAQATQRHLPLLTALNGGAEIGGPRKRSGGIPGLAGGGPVSWQELQGVVKGRFPNARITDTLRPGAHDFHGAGKAIDIAGPRPGDMPFMLDVNRYIAGAFGGSAELIHTQPGAVNIKNGKGHQYSPAVQAGHRDHVHWANNGGKPGGFKGWISGVGEAISTFFRDSVRDAFDKFTNPALDGLRKFVGPPPPAWREAVPALATKARDTVRDWVFGKADEKDQAASSGGAGMMGPVGDGEIFVIGQIADSARAHRVGFDGGAIGVATGIVESGLRNLNYGDRDSVGVFQQRGNGAWGSLEQRMNVRHASDMFFNKLVSFNWRGMDPGAAAQKVQASAFPAKYGQAMGRARELLAAHGGPFDSGGLAFGTGFMFKDVVQPERVLSPAQTRDYDTLSRAVRRVDVGASAASSVGHAEERRPIEVNVYPRDRHDEQHIADAVLRRLEFETTLR